MFHRIAFVFNALWRREGVRASREKCFFKVISRRKHLLEHAKHLLYGCKEGLYVFYFLLLFPTYPNRAIC